VTKRALELKPARVALWVLIGPFLLLGLLLHFVWLLPALLIGAGIDGWQSGARMVEQWRAAAREQQNG